MNDKAKPQHQFTYTIDIMTFEVIERMAKKLQ